MKTINRQTGQMSERTIKPMETVWFKYENIFTNDYRSVSQDYKNHLHTFTQTEFPDELNQPYVRRWTMDINKYASNYNYFDVSLAPLVKSEFNANKSQLKVIEAGFHKKAIIATEEDPYLIDLVSSVERGGGINPKGNSLLVSTKNNYVFYLGSNSARSNPSRLSSLDSKFIGGSFSCLCCINLDCSVDC